MTDHNKIYPTADPQKLTRNQEIDDRLTGAECVIEEEVLGLPHKPDPLTDEQVMNACSYTSEEWAYVRELAPVKRRYKLAEKCWFPMIIALRECRSLILRNFKSSAERMREKEERARLWAEKKAQESGKVFKMTLEERAKSAAQQREYRAKRKARS